MFFNLTDCIIISGCKIKTYSMFSQVFSGRKAQKRGGFATQTPFSGHKAAVPSTKSLRKVRFCHPFSSKLTRFRRKYTTFTPRASAFSSLLASCLTTHPNFRTLYMPLRPFAQLCRLQDAINPFQKYKYSSFSLCNHLKFCIFVNNIRLSAMSPTKE